MILVPLFDLKSLTRSHGLHRRDFKSAALGMSLFGASFAPAYAASKGDMVGDYSIMA